MYLTKIVLNTGNSKVLDCIDNANKMHKLVMSGFGNSDSEEARKDLGILYRMTIKGNTCSLTIQSDSVPDYNHLIGTGIIEYPQTKDMSRFIDSISNGQRLYLDILSEPYKKVPNVDANGVLTKNSRRKVLTNYDDKIEWFNKKISESCFIDVADVEKSKIELYGRKATGRFIYRPSQYKCMVRVKDKEDFLRMLHDGIGSGKSYGMGMIQIFR